MKLESAISSINRILRQTVKTFGINTGEYQEMKYLVESIGKNIDLFIHTATNEPIRLSKGRMALVGLKGYQDDIEKTLEAMREKGTILQQVKAKYDETMTAKRLSSPIDIARIQKLAKHVTKYVTLPLQKFSDCKGLKGTAFDAKADEAIEFVRQCLMNEEQALKDLNTEKSKTLGGSTNLAGALSYQK